MTHQIPGHEMTEQLALAMCQPDCIHCFIEAEIARREEASNPVDLAHLLNSFCCGIASAIFDSDERDAWLDQVFERIRLYVKNYRLGSDTLPISAPIIEAPEPEELPDEEASDAARIPDDLDQRVVA